MHVPEDRIQVTVQAATGAVVLGVRGEIDLGNAAKTGDVLRSAAADTPPPWLVVLDLTELAFLSAAGVRALYGFAAENGERGVRTRLVVAPDSVVGSVARLAELHAHVPMYTTLAEALDRGAPAE